MQTCECPREFAAYMFRFRNNELNTSRVQLAAHPVLQPHHVFVEHSEERKSRAEHDGSITYWFAERPGFEAQWAAPVSMN